MKKQSNNNFPANTFNKLERSIETENYTSYIRKECEKYGIPIGIFSSGKEIYTDYEREALTLIEMRKKLSPELQIKLLSTKDSRRNNRSNSMNTSSIDMTDELAEEILGIKF